MGIKGSTISRTFSLLLPADRHVSTCFYGPLFLRLYINLQSTKRKSYPVYRPTRPNLTPSGLSLLSLPKYRQRPSGRDGYLARVVTTNSCCHLNIWHNFIFCSCIIAFDAFDFALIVIVPSLLSFYTCTLRFRCAICHVNYLYLHIIHIALTNTVQQEKKQEDIVLLTYTA